MPVAYACCPGTGTGDGDFGREDRNLQHRMTGTVGNDIRKTSVSVLNGASAEYPEPGLRFASVLDL